MSSHTNAAIFLGTLALAMFIWIIYAFRRSPYTIPQTVLYAGCVLLTRVLWRTTAPPELPLPANQGAVIVCNHRSSIDPFFVQLIASTPVHWLVTRNAYESVSFGWFLKTVETIPVRRGGIDTLATKMAIRMATEGGIVGLFPEGRINLTDDFMLKVRPGAIKIALKARVNVLPCYLEGAPYGGTEASPLLMPARVTLHIGPQIDLSDFFGREREANVLKYLTEFCVGEIARLAGVAFKPEIAGRNWLPADER